MNEKSNNPIRYLSYLLRLWRTGDDNPWKASLEDPRTGQRVGFQNLETLQTYLREQTRGESEEVLEIGHPTSLE